MSTEVGHSRGERLATYVAGRAAKLQSGYRRDDSVAVAQLALLRRGVSGRLGDDVRLVGLTVGGLDPHPNGLPTDPRPHEDAAYAALTLFALHQQSHHDQNMHRRGYSLGSSAQWLGKRTRAEEAVRARFTAVATATSWNETLHHARGLISQFRAQAVPLDYGRFARDLYHLQYPESASRVRLNWGRDFYRAPTTDTDTDTDGTDAAEPRA